MLDDPSIHSWPALQCCALLVSEGLKLNVSYLKHYFPFCFSSDQFPQLCISKRTKFRLSFSRLHICLGLLSNPPTWIFQFGCVCSILENILLMHFVLFCFLIQDVLAISLYSCKTYPSSPSQVPLESCVSSVYVNPLQRLQPLSSGVFANIPLVHNA